MSDTVASLVTRLIYTKQNWRYYVESSIGFALIDTTDYINLKLRDHYSNHYANQSNVNFEYGFAIGIVHFISPKTSIGISLDYSDLGNAALGPRWHSPLTPPVIGKISQRQRLIAGIINITHWFGR